MDSINIGPLNLQYPV